MNVAGMKRIAALVTIFMLMVVACGDVAPESTSTPAAPSGALSGRTTPEVQEPEPPTATRAATHTATEPESAQENRQGIAIDSATNEAEDSLYPNPTATPLTASTAGPTATPAIDDTLQPPVPEITSCEHAADLAIERVQFFLNALDDVPVEVIRNGAPMPEMLEGFAQELDLQMTEIEAAADDLGCSDDVMQALMVERIDQLEAHSPTAEIFLEQLELAVAGIDMDLPATATAAPTATTRHIDLNWDVKTCADVADLFIDRVQLLLYDFDDMELEVFTGDDPPEPMQRFEQDIELLAAASDELGCDSTVLNELIAEQVDRLVARGSVSQLILEGLLQAIADGEVFPLE